MWYTVWTAEQYLFASLTVPETELDIEVSEPANEPTNVEVTDADLQDLTDLQACLLCRAPGKLVSVATEVVRTVLMHNVLFTMARIVLPHPKLMPLHMYFLGIWFC